MGIIQFYSTNGIRWDEAVTAVHDGHGEVFTCVIRTAKKGMNETELAYGMFFRDLDGTICDCLQPTRTSLKTSRTAEVAFQFLREAYPDCWEFSLPVLDENNLVLPNEIGDRTILRHKQQVRLSDKDDLNR